MPHPDPVESAVLVGRRVLIARTADRARPLVDLLRQSGAEPWVLPLIDFEQARDQASLTAALDRLTAGGFDWLVISSITTVRVLLDHAAQRGIELNDLVPSGTKVATIGPASQRAVESVGLTVHMAPTENQSADGLLALWNSTPGTVLLPQADIAAPGLRSGLASQGADVTAVVAYHTVDYPARDHLRLTAKLPSAVGSSDDATVGLEEATEGLRAGTIHAIVAASPSGARRIASALPELGACRFIAIGRPTAAAASQLGLAVAATAKVPTPDGIVAALESVFANEGNPS
ncbi:uroporphyrinogen-III synthase [Paenarthrobacter ilicis]|uniref:uroporphyrinogen-III synthase n=1 Tax=Paenarthrobacter ilicis TaxID=43665 RepID=UPI00386BE4D9